MFKTQAAANLYDGTETITARKHLRLISLLPKSLDIFTSNMQFSGPQMSNELSFEKLFLRFTGKEISRRHTEINTNIRDT